MVRYARDVLACGQILYAACSTVPPMQGRDEGGTSAMTPDKINAITVIRRLLENINRRQVQMDDLWKERRAVLEQTLELRVFEKAMQKVWEGGGGGGGGG